MFTRVKWQRSLTNKLPFRITSLHQLRFENQRLDIVYTPDRQAAFNLAYSLLDQDASIQVLNVFDKGERLAHYRAPVISENGYQIIVCIKEEQNG